jgi:hypothetical protein
MIVEDEKESIREILDLKGNPSAIIIWSAYKRQP